MMNETSGQSPFDNAAKKDHKPVPRTLAMVTKYVVASKTNARQRPMGLSIERGVWSQQGRAQADLDYLHKSVVQ